MEGGSAGLKLACANRHRKGREFVMCHSPAASISGVSDLSGKPAFREPR